MSDSSESSLRQELERVSRELKACKNELRKKEKALVALKEKKRDLPGSNTLSKKEASIKRITTDMEKAQEMATMGSWVLEVDTGAVSWSQGLYKIFGLDPSSPPPVLQKQESLYTEKSWKGMIEAVTRTVEEGIPYNIELEAVRLDGSIVVLRSIGEAERDDTGRIVRIHGVAQDITRIKENEAELRLALEQEKTAQIYKDQFLANMSHEIRTPMNGVVGFASLLRDENIDTRTRNTFIDNIENCSNHLLHLINDILDIAKIEAGELEIEKKAVNVVKLMRGTAALLESRKVKKGKEQIRLITSIPKGADNLEIITDPMRIQQILTNLLSNALKFSDEGTIEFGFELLDGAIEFFVKDEGIGIEPGRIPHIFERFEHFEEASRKYEGTGLGLSISKGLAGLLGGDLTVESELGQGSVLRLKIPVEVKLSKDSHKVVSPPSPVETKAIESGTVLVAEDEEANRTLIRMILRSTPFKVLFAENGEEAILTYKNHPGIDVVLMDIRMPVMCGDEAAREILKINQDAKIIAQTAYAMNGQREEYLELGFADYISKPFSSMELRSILHKWIHVNRNHSH